MIGNLPLFQAVLFLQVSLPKSCISLSPTCATCPTHLILLHLISHIKFRDCTNNNAHYAILPACYFHQFRPKYLPPTDQVLHPYITASVEVRGPVQQLTVSCHSSLTSCWLFTTTQSKYWQLRSCAQHFHTLAVYITLCQYGDTAPVCCTKCYHFQWPQTVSCIQ